MMFMDTHCHLDADFDGLSVNEVLQQASDAGVGRIVLPAVSPSGWDACLQLAQSHSGVFVALGIHPQCVRDLTAHDLASALVRLDGLLAEAKVVAVGEVGIDHRWDAELDARRRQDDAFMAQLDLAQAHRLPPIIHCLDAHGRFSEIWAQHACRHTIHGIMHSYSGSAELMQTYTTQNLFISYSGGVTWSGAKRVPRACQATPEEWLLIETDAPYQPPHPLQPGANRPDQLVRVAEVVAQLRGTTLEHIAQITFENGLRAFNLAHSAS